MPQTIFIFSLLGRSGTNYLARLLALHPDCALPQQPFVENWFLEEADRLVQYCDHLTKTYRKKKFRDVEKSDRIVADMGRTLLNLLYEDSESHGRRIVTKTPSVFGLNNFQRLFPEQLPLVIVRDARSIAESFHHAWGHDRNLVANWWKEQAQAYFNYLQSTASAAYRIRYERLVTNVTGELTALFRYLNLDPATYDFAAAEQLLIQGSSFHKAESGELDWTPQQQDAEFAPTTRFAGWTEQQHRAFNEIAGFYLTQLGYELMHPLTEPDST